jgi:hypothetical protein
VKDTSRSKAKSSLDSHTRKILVYANGIAALFMFFSWLGQNIYQSEMSSIQSDLERNVQFVNSEMTKALIWTEQFQNEIRKEKPDPEIILNSAIGYADVTGTIVRAASRVDPNSAVLKKHVEDHKKFADMLQAAANKRDVEDLKTVAGGLMMWFGGIGPEASEAINRRAQEVSDGEEKGKWVFRVFFLLASLLLAWTWWKTNVDSLRSLVQR